MLLNNIKVYVLNQITHLWQRTKRMHAKCLLINTLHLPSTIHIIV